MEKFNLFAIFIFVLVAVSVIGQDVKPAVNEEPPPASDKILYPKGAAVSTAVSEMGTSYAASISKNGGDAIARADNGSETRASAMAKLGGSAHAVAIGGNQTKANALAAGGGDAVSHSNNYAGGESYSKAISDQGFSSATSQAAEDANEAAWLKSEGEKLFGKEQVKSGQAY